MDASNTNPIMNTPIYYDENGKMSEASKPILMEQIRLFAGPCSMPKAKLERMMQAPPPPIAAATYDLLGYAPPPHILDTNDPRVVKYVNLAIDYHNSEQGTCYKLVEIESANMSHVGSGKLHSLIFQAKTPHAEPVKISATVTEHRNVASVSAVKLLLELE